MIDGNSLGIWAATYTARFTAVLSLFWLLVGIGIGLLF
jgi:hypothetical protein